MAALARMGWPGRGRFRPDRKDSSSRARAVRIAAVSTVRDEGDIIACTIEHLLSEGVDLVIVADNLSRDDTVERVRKVQANFPENVLLVHDDEEAFWQGRRMTRLARLAAGR
jgi:Ribonuclease G/E